MQKNTGIYRRMKAINKQCFWDFSLLMLSSSNLSHKPFFNLSRLLSPLPLLPLIYLISLPLTPLTFLSGKRLSEIILFVEVWFKQTVLEERYCLLNTLALNQRVEICGLYRDTTKYFWQPVQPLMMPVRPRRLFSQPEDRSSLSCCQLQNNEWVSSLLLMVLWISLGFICPLSA